MGFHGIERIDKPFVVKSPYKPSGDQPKAIDELATRIENGETDGVNGCHRYRVKQQQLRGLLSDCRDLRLF